MSKRKRTKRRKDRGRQDHPCSGTTRNKMGSWTVSRLLHPSSGRRLGPIPLRCWPAPVPLMRRGRNAGNLVAWLARSWLPVAVPRPRPARVQRPNFKGQSRLAFVRPKGHASQSHHGTAIERSQASEPHKDGAAGPRNHSRNAMPTRRLAK